MRWCAYFSHLPYNPVTVRADITTRIMLGHPIGAQLRNGVLVEFKNSDGSVAYAACRIEGRELSVRTILLPWQALANVQYRIRAIDDTSRGKRHAATRAGRNIAKKRLKRKKPWRVDHSVDSPKPWLPGSKRHNPPRPRFDEDSDS